MPSPPSGQTRLHLDGLCALPENEGYKTMIVPDGPIALQIIDEALPDLILLDVRMPGMEDYHFTFCSAHATLWV